MLKDQPLHPLKHALQIFTDTSKEGWGVHLNERTARGAWSLPESKLHINYLELKAVFLALKEFQDLCLHNIVLVATDNTTVVAYINKEGGIRSGPLCALLWRSTTHHRQAEWDRDKLSRLGQTIQTEWSLHPEVFQAICNRWHKPQVDLFATRFNNKLPKFVSPVQNPQALAADMLSLSWEDLDPYLFPPAAILGKVVEKLQDYLCNRIILIAPGWSNMPFLGPSGHAQSDPTVPTQSAKSGDSTIQADPAQASIKPKPTCLAPRATAINEQGFSEAVEAQIEALQRGSTRSVYKAK